jgi:serine/threonine protein kinase
VAPPLVFHSSMDGRGPMKSDPGAVGRCVGRYEIVRQIGQGAMATVHLARQIDLDRTVALKELDRFGAGDSGVFAARFLREARLAGSLSHANIVTVYEYFENAGRPYIAMEHVERGSLRGHLEGLSLPQIIGVLRGLLAALTHAEARGIVHRDIKPENILVTSDGQVKIADFGIAKAYLVSGPLLTATGATVGTPMYMAPEQATGKQIGIATDLYAVGVVAFEMLFGYVPFGSGESPIAIIWQHVNDPIPDPRALRPDLDLRLCRWLEQLLAKDAADRPVSAVVALDALEEIALELLGNRWHRGALIPVRTAATPDPPRPEPRSQAPIDEAPAVSCGAGRAPTRDAGDPIIAPPALSGQTEHYARERRDRPIDEDPAPPKALWSIAALVLVAAVTLAAAGGGYLLFDRDSQAGAGSAVATRFMDGLARAFVRLNEVRVSARNQMGSTASEREQAGQARAIASAYRRAAANVRELAAPADLKTAVARLESKLLSAGRVYDALGVAANAGRTDEYETKASAVSAREKAVLRAFELIERAAKSSG